MRTLAGIINTLQQEDLPLPGRAAHSLLSPLSIRDYDPPASGYREAAVMFLIYPRDGEWHTVYIERSRNQPKDKHAGQISLPGGKVEVSDADYAAAACRELEEEIGVPRSTVEVIRPLSDLYIIPSNFMVYPYIGIIDYTPDFVLQPSEVESIIEIPLAEVRALSVTRDDLDVRGQAMRDVPYYDLKGHVLWGATSMITAEFKHLLDHTDIG